MQKIFFFVILIMHQAISIKGITKKACLIDALEDDANNISLNRKKLCECLALHLVSHYNGTISPKCEKSKTVHTTETHMTFDLKTICECPMPTSTTYATDTTNTERTPGRIERHTSYHYNVTTNTTTDDTNNVDNTSNTHEDESSSTTTSTYDINNVDNTSNTHEVELSSTQPTLEVASTTTDDINNVDNTSYTHDVELSSTLPTLEVASTTTDDINNVDNTSNTHDVKLSSTLRSTLEVVSTTTDDINNVDNTSNTHDVELSSTLKSTFKVANTTTDDINNVKDKSNTHENELSSTSEISSTTNYHEHTERTTKKSIIKKPTKIIDKNNTTMTSKLDDNKRQWKTKYIVLILISALALATIVILAAKFLYSKYRTRTYEPATVANRQDMELEQSL